MTWRMGPVVRVSLVVCVVAALTFGCRERSSSVGVAEIDPNSPGAVISGSPSGRTETIFTGDFNGIAPNRGSGKALLIINRDGSRTIRFVDFEVTEGPRLRVYLSTASPGEPQETFDDDFLDMGALLAASGRQDYVIPAEVDISRFRSVVVWSRNLHTAYAVAPIT